MAVDPKLLEAIKALSNEDLQEALEEKKKHESKEIYDQIANHYQQINLLRKKINERGAKAGGSWLKKKGYPELPPDADK